MGLIFSNDDPPRLDADSEERARKLAVSRTLSDHQDEFDRHYAEIYDMLLREETDKFNAMGNVGIKITEDEVKYLYEAIKISYDSFNRVALKIWKSQGHNATKDATFLVKRQEHWPTAMLLIMNVPT